VSETFKAALDAALQFHNSHTGDASKGDILDTAKIFYRELAVAAPSGVDNFTEDWDRQVWTWLRVLNGDQLGCVSTAVQRISAERNPSVAPLLAQPPGPYASVPPVHQEAWALLDKLNGPQLYPGTAAPIGPLVTRDELEQRLAELGGDRNNAGEVATAAGSWRDRTLAPEPAAISEALGRQDGETLLATAERVATELAAAKDKIRQLEGNSLVLPYPQILAAINETLGRRSSEAPTAAAERVMSELAGWKIRAEHAEARVTAARPVAPPLAEAGNQIRIRTRGADVYTSTTVATELEYSPTEGFFALVPPGAFAEGRRDEIATESIDALLKALAPAKLSGTILQQVKVLVGTVSGLRNRIKELETGRETFESEIRTLLGAQDEQESDDHWCPRQPTLDAVQRVMRRLLEIDRHADGAKKTKHEVIDALQNTWHYDGHKELKA
jgi:hypothetical protein